MPSDADEVVDFFLDNSSELERIKHVMRPVTKMVPCNTYGCMDPKPEGSIFCAGCYQDYREDPDAYK